MKQSRAAEDHSDSRHNSKAGHGSPRLSLFGVHRCDLLACLIVIAGAVILALPILVRGFPNGDDGFVHYRWAAEFHEAFREKGVFYPRWLSSANNGQGSPVMLYFPPLPLFVSEAINALVRNTMLALQLSCLLGMTASGLALYVLARALVSPVPSLFAAILYMVAPYHIFDLYHRTAISEYWAFVWVPLVLDAIGRIAKGAGWRTVIYLALSFSLLVFSHVIMAFAVMLVLPVFALMLTRKPRRLIEVASGLALGAGITAVFTASIIFERDYSRIHRALRLKYANNFQFENLFNSINVRLFTREEVRLYFGEWIDVTAFCVVLLVIAALLVIWSRRRDEHQRLGNALLRAMLAVTGLSLLMTARVSSPIWRVIPKLPYMQFPFRWLVIATLGACVLAGIAFSTLLGSFRRSFLCSATLAAVVVFNLTISGLAIARASHDRLPLEEGLTALEVPEYRPVQWDNELHMQEPLPAIALKAGEADLRIIDDQGIEQSYEIDASVESELQLRQLYFPGWVARIDEHPIDLQSTEDGHLKLIVPGGRHTLTLKFGDTRPRFAGKLFSAASLMICVLIAVFSRHSFSKKEPLASGVI